MNPLFTLLGIVATPTTGSSVILGKGCGILPDGSAVFVYTENGALKLGRVDAQGVAAAPLVLAKSKAVLSSIAVNGWNITVGYSAGKDIYVLTNGGGSTANPTGTFASPVYLGPGDYTPLPFVVAGGEAIVWTKNPGTDLPGQCWLAKRVNGIWSASEQTTLGSSVVNATASPYGSTVQLALRWGDDASIRLWVPGDPKPTAIFAKGAYDPEITTSPATGGFLVAYHADASCYVQSLGMPATLLGTGKQAHVAILPNGVPVAAWSGWPSASDARNKVSATRTIEVAYLVGEPPVMFSPTEETGQESIGGIGFGSGLLAVPWRASGCIRLARWRYQ